METIKLHGHVDADGILKLQLPVELADQELEVYVVAPAPERKRGWPPGYFERTAGSLADDPIERPSQGNYEARELLE